MNVAVTFGASNQTFDLTMHSSDQSFALGDGFGEIIVVDSYPRYNGPYEVTPKVDAQVMATKDKVMRDDVTIRGVPYYEVSNQSGGNTVYIAREVNE